jgi:hypothetical protein
MTMQRIATLAAAALVLGSLQMPAAAASPTEDQQVHAIEAFRVLSSAMLSAKVDDQLKSQLMGCIYANSLGQISEAMDKAIADHPDKFDRSDPNAVLTVMAGVCGYRPPAAPPPATAPTAAAPAPATTSR